MGTCSAIAFKNEENYTIIHCHWDGYPEGLGQTLQDNIIKLGYDRVYQFFKDTNVSLWRELCSCDFGDLENDNHDSPNNCVTCKQKLEKQQKNNKEKTL